MPDGSSMLPAQAPNPQGRVRSARLTNLTQRLQERCSLHCHTHHHEDVPPLDSSLSAQESTSLIQTRIFGQSCLRMSPESRDLLPRDTGGTVFNSAIMRKPHIAHAFIVSTGTLCPTSTISLRETSSKLSRCWLSYPHFNVHWWLPNTPAPSPEQPLDLVGALPHNPRLI